MAVVTPVKLLISNLVELLPSLYRAFLLATRWW